MTPTAESTRLGPWGISFTISLLRNRFLEQCSVSVNVLISYLYMCLPLCCLRTESRAHFSGTLATKE